MLNFTYQKQLIKSVLVQQNIDLTDTCYHSTFIILSIKEQNSIKYYDGQISIFDYQANACTDISFSIIDDFGKNNSVVCETEVTYVYAIH